MDSGIIFYMGLSIKYITLQERKESVCDGGGKIMCILCIYTYKLKCHSLLWCMYSVGMHVFNRCHICNIMLHGILWTPVLALVHVGSFIFLHFTSKKFIIIIIKTFRSKSLNINFKIQIVLIPNFYFDSVTYICRGVRDVWQFVTKEVSGEKWSKLAWPTLWTIHI